MTDLRAINGTTILRAAIVAAAGMVSSIALTGDDHVLIESDRFEYNAWPASLAGQTVVQLNRTGPRTITYVQDGDDPRI